MTPFISGTLGLIFLTMTLWSYQYYRCSTILNALNMPKIENILRIFLNISQIFPQDPNLFWTCPKYPKMAKIGPQQLSFLYFWTEYVSAICKKWYWLPRKIFKKIQNFEHAQKGPKWPKMAEIRPSHLIFWLIKTENFLTLCAKWNWLPRKNFKTIQNFEHVQNGPKWPKMAQIRS